MIIPGRHSGGMQQPTAVQRLVDAMLDRAERGWPRHLTERSWLGHLGTLPPGAPIFFYISDVPRVV